MLFGRRREAGAPAADAWLVVGLGNPGAEYERNRHNIGFRVLDELARRRGVRFDQRKFSGRFAASRHDGQAMYLLKPNTYVNDSGKAVGGAVRFYHLEPARLLVVCDDIDLPFERIRIRAEGSSGGHNGLKSIIQALGGRQDFPRIRLGVDRPPHVREVVVDHVLDDFSREQEEQLPALLADAADAAELILAGDIRQAMDRYNGVRPGRELGIANSELGKSGP